MGRGGKPTTLSPRRAEYSRRYRQAPPCRYMGPADYVPGPAGNGKDPKASGKRRRRRLGVYV